MIEFKIISNLITEQEIANQEEFDSSDYGGVDKLLQTSSYEDLLFVSDEDDDEAGELYYFLEANANHLKRDGNKLLVEMEGIRFVLVDLHGEVAIAINEKYKEAAENLM